MDPTVPLAAARLLDFVRATEVGTEGPSGYNVIFGFNQDKLPKPVTQMTVDELIGAQASFTSRFGSSASGAYQFMRRTLQDLKRELGLRGSQVMDPNLQDRLAFHLLKRRGYDAFMSGQISRTEFGKRLAQEWASFPVLASVRGAHRQLSRGQSFYTGDPLNKALVSADEFERVIDEAKALGDAMPAPLPVPMPRPEEEPAMPAPIGHNGGPPLDKSLTPIEQMNKPVGGAVLGSGVTMPVGAAAAILMSSAGWLPDAWMEGTPAIAFGIFTGWAATQIGNLIGSYRAPDKRFTADAS